jgi:hypothetical protein
VPCRPGRTVWTKAAAGRSLPPFSAAVSSDFFAAPLGFAALVFFFVAIVVSSRLTLRVISYEPRFAG